MSTIRLKGDTRHLATCLRQIDKTGMWPAACSNADERELTKAGYLIFTDSYKVTDSGRDFYAVFSPWG